VKRVKVTLRSIDDQRVLRRAWRLNNGVAVAGQGDPGSRDRDAFFANTGERDRIAGRGLLNGVIQACPFPQSTDFLPASTGTFKASAHTTTAQFNRNAM